MTKFPLGALLEGEYVLPCEVEKNTSGLSCPGCGECVVVKKGDIKAHHFSHKPGERDCKFYEHPGEGDIHKMAKHIIAFLLKQRKIKKVVRSCSSCKDTNFDERIEYEEDDEVVIEYRVSDKCIVDVAVVNSGKVKYIFEIYDTHKTIRETPEPWFEIDAKKFLKETENGTILKKERKYRMDTNLMKIEDVLQEMCDAGCEDFKGTLKENRTKLQVIRNFDTSESEECVYCMRTEKCCPSCKVRMAKFKATQYNNKNSHRANSVKQRIINSKEYEECYPAIRSIKSILDHKGTLKVYIDRTKFNNSTPFIRDKFENLIRREWCEIEGESEFYILDFKSASAV
jgi:hypothetical protein